MDELDLISESYSYEARHKNLINNPLLSDVCFLVGVNKTKIYAHQMTLAIGSPVFYKMFYGDLGLKEDKQIIIPDLTAEGFLNMIKYINGYKVDDFKLEEIYETYKEIDILKSVQKWIIAQLKRENLEPNSINSQLIFNNFKHLINYSKLTIDELSKFKNIKLLLNSQDIGNLFLHLIDNTNPLFNYSKISGELKILSVYSAMITGLDYQAPKFEIELNVNKEVIIKSIITTTNSILKRIEIFGDYRVFKADLYYNSTTNDTVEFEDSDLLILRPNKIYKIVFIAKQFSFFKRLSNQKILKCEEYNDGILFELEFNRYHCIKKINFLDFY